MPDEPTALKFRGCVPSYSKNQYPECSQPGLIQGIAYAVGEAKLWTQPMDCFDHWVAESIA